MPTPLTLACLPPPPNAENPRNQEKPGMLENSCNDALRYFQPSLDQDHTRDARPEYVFCSPSEDRFNYTFEADPNAGTRIVEKPKVYNATDAIFEVSQKTGVFCISAGDLRSLA